MKIISIILWIAIILLIISFTLSIRNRILEGFGVTMQTVNSTMLLALQAVVIAAIGWSSLHFLWMIPIAFVLGTMSIMFPFSLLSFFGNFYARLCCAGLDNDVIEQNEKRAELFRQLLDAGHSPEEAVNLSLSRPTQNKTRFKCSPLPPYQLCFTACSASSFSTSSYMQRTLKARINLPQMP